MIFKLSEDNSLSSVAQLSEVWVKLWKRKVVDKTRKPTTSKI